MATNQITLCLGPTNTGKTYRAIERMLDFSSGMMGLPLRLLAREVYDRVSERVGESKVALITGEEKRVPSAPRYFICTVEAMPRDREVEFVAVDEVQLASHPDRGHIFTERLLSARGTRETWFLGAGTMSSLLKDLLPGASVSQSPRFSTLRHTGVSTLGGLPPRSAVVCFRHDRVYEFAERLRRRRGGAAVVLGALSPRARNAQVALYQAKEVAHLVATDAIGMGLNLDLDHVSFADVAKFDGREHRDLDLGELAQIAGRAGRYARDGTFGTLSGGKALGPGAARAVESHQLPSVRELWWRNELLDFRSVDALRASLLQTSGDRRLLRARPADDERAFVALSARPELGQHLESSERVQLLWQVASVPDYKKVLFEDHLALLARVFLMLCNKEGKLESDWFAGELQRIDSASPELDALMFALAELRVLVYLAHQSGWLRDAAHFQGRARALEDTLSDQLHQALVGRFVEPKRRSASGSRQPVTVAPGSGSPFAALAVLRERLWSHEPEAAEGNLIERAIDAGTRAFSLGEDASIRFDGQLLGRLSAGKDLLNPEVVVSTDATPGERLRLQRRLVALARDIRSELIDFVNDIELSAAGRGVAYVLRAGLGTAWRSELREQADLLEAGDLEAFSRAGVRFGTLVVFAPRLLKPDAILRRQALVAAWLGGLGKAHWPSGREVSIPTRGFASRSLLLALGYPAVGPRGVRADILEKVTRALDGPLPKDKAAAWLGCKTGEADQVLAEVRRMSESGDPGADEKR